MADSGDADSTQSRQTGSRRLIYTRRNTNEERLKQKKERKKRRRERDREARNAATRMRQEVNQETADPANEARNSEETNAVVNDTRIERLHEEGNNPANDKRIDQLQEEPNDPANATRIGLKKSCSPPPKPVRSDVQTSALAYSRGAQMLKLARGTRVFPAVGFTEPKTRRMTAAHRHPHPVEKESEIRKPKTALKELNPDHLEYLSEHAIGSGSYGQCYRARYRGIEVIVKKMTHDNTPEGKEKARRNLLHEATVASALGDHERLPLIFGVSQNHPFCLVTLFHGVRDESLTLHQAANTSMLTPPESTEIFIQICSALKHVHSRGYLHNDIKANNVVLERNPMAASKKYNPVLIDFGKSTPKAAASSVTPSIKRMTAEQKKSYLAPEVVKHRLYSAASDIYSLGKMLKAVSRMLGFYPEVRALVKEATAETPSLRPSIDKFMNTLSAVKFE